MVSMQYLKGLNAVGGGFGLVARDPQGVTQEVAYPWLVIDHQDRRHRSSAIQ